jgi:phosphoribosyl-AMP cyclohydrolase
MTDFAPPAAGKSQEEDTVFRPKFGEDGLVTAVACEASTGEILMLAHMNAEALEKTLHTGQAHYWSRSRKAIWLKGETSGNIQQVREIRTDCDQDAIVLKVAVAGSDASCHTGRVSCFYRLVKTDAKGNHILEFEKRDRIFDPDSVYGR